MTAEDLRSYFQQFGEVTDVFVPKPFRAFAFVTFTDPDVAQSLCGDDHIIKGTSVHLSCATPKSVERYTDKLMQTGRGFGGYSGFGKGGEGWMPDAGRGKQAGGSGFSAGGSYGMSGSGMGGGSASQFQLNPAMMAAAQAAFAQGLLGMMNMNQGSSGGYGGGYGPGSGADSTAKPVQSGGGGSYGGQAGSGDTQAAAGGYSSTQMPANNYGSTGSNQGYGGWTPSQQTDSHGSNASWSQPRPPAPGWN